MFALRCSRSIVPLKFASYSSIFALSPAAVLGGGPMKGILAGGGGTLPPTFAATTLRLSCRSDGRGMPPEPDPGACPCGPEESC